MVVLIVEDEVLVGMVFSLVLNVAGYRVVGPAGSVRDALDLAAMVEPDIAFVDVNLERDGDGIELARILHQRYGTTCIFLTAQPDRAQTASDAAIGVVAKPYNPDGLIEVVEYAAAIRSGTHRRPAPAALALLG